MFSSRKVFAHKGFHGRPRSALQHQGNWRATLRDIPDGEVFSCPIKDSVKGAIQFNTPTIYSGTRFENVRLEFSKGRIVNATSNNNKRLNEIRDTDAGVRYIGKFS